MRPFHHPCTVINFHPAFVFLTGSCDRRQLMPTKALETKKKKKSTSTHRRRAEVVMGEKGHQKAPQEGEWGKGILVRETLQEDQLGSTATAAFPPTDFSPSAFLLAWSTPSCCWHDRNCQGTGPKNLRRYKTGRFTHNKAS